MSHHEHKQKIGWKEWVALPELGLPHIKAKVDTGAKTSAIHAYNLTTFERKNATWIRFWIHPLPKREDISVMCEAPALEQRVVSDSGGHKERRWVIATMITIGDTEHRIEITLTNRREMKFRMLLGRAVLAGFLIDTNKSYLLGRPKAPRRAYTRKADKGKLK